MEYLPARSQDRPSDDPIFALNREAAQRRARGEPVINATVGAMLDDSGALAVLPSVVRALAEVPVGRAAAYAPIAGHPEFLEGVVRDLLGGTPLAASATAVATPGGTGALRHALSLFLERGQALLTTSYYWGPYATLCDEQERGLRTFTMFDAGGRFNADALAEALTATAAAQGRLLVFLNDPCHNPTGYTLDDADWRAAHAALADAAGRVPTTVLLDVAYLAYARDRRFLAHVAPLAERALLLFAWSASKTFTQYGLRVGALVACTTDARQRDAITRALSFASRGVWSNCSSGGQLAIARCLNDDALRAAVDAEREVPRAMLAARVDAWNAAARATTLRYPRYDGGFFVTVFTDEARAVAERLKADGVYVVPQAGALRVALCGVAAADVPRLVSALAARVITPGAAPAPRGATP